MKCIVELSEAEKKTLQQLSLKHRYQDFRLRGQGLLLLGDGQLVRDVAEQLDVSMKSVYNWSHWWREKGLCGLLVGHKGGRPRSLSEAMITTAVEVASAESLELREIAQQIETVHGPLPYELETLGEALKREGFSYKRGRYSLKKSRTPRSSP
ncbi:helix-turn-helix domain-containing protein [Cupriavidus necator]